MQIACSFFEPFGLFAHRSGLAQALCDVTNQSDLDDSTAINSPIPTAITTITRLPNYPIQKRVTSTIAPSSTTL